MIVTLTINPAIDQTVTVERLVFEDRTYILSQAEDPGGRGLNASRVIHSFGGKTLAILTAGGGAGKRIQEGVAQIGFPSEIIPVRSDSRLNFTISDKQGLTVKLNELGRPIEKAELERVRAAVEQAIRRADWLMICGSIPPGVRPHFYYELIEMAQERKVKTLVDTDGDALLRALEAHPTVIAPNQQEVERLLNRALLTRGQILEAVRRVQGMGPESVMISLGSRGAIASNKNEIIEAIPPRVEALCPIGAGDALAAAFVWAMSNNRTFSEAVQWGVAAGTASARLPGMNFATLEQTKEIYPHVEVRPAK